MSKVDHTYVNRLYEELVRDFEGFHKRIDEIERIRYLEDKLGLSGQETNSGLEVRIGATSQLIEDVKAAITAGKIKVKFRPLRGGALADENSSKREKFWQEYLRWINRPVKVLSEGPDSQVGAGISILKGAYYPWPKDERKQLKGEPDKAYNLRQKNQKRLWGPPLRVVTVHPLSYYFRLGEGNMIVESIEHSYKSKRAVYDAYGIESDATLSIKPQQLTSINETSAVPTVSGMPIERIRPLPFGASTDTLVLVTEYKSDEAYQCYVNGRLIYEEEGYPSVCYFPAFGRTTSSKDPDKYGFSVAELLRHNEPIINRTLTRMAEAAELLVRKRLTLEVPDGYMPETELGEDNNPVAKTWKFDPSKTEALPAGAKVVDPFEGSENVYAAMPMVELLLRLNGQHGVAPIFKGVPPGAGSSGYRDNSLFMMAQNQFNYIVENYGDQLTELVKWSEYQIVYRSKQEVFCGPYSLRPKDIEDFPCEVEVIVDPALPVSIIAEGQFYDRMHARGHIRRRTVLEKGLREEQPEDEMYGRMEEDMQELLKPQLYQEVLQAVGALAAAAAQQPPEGTPTILGPDGQPLKPSNQQRNGSQMMPEDMANRELGNSMGGMTRAGAAREPNVGPGEVY